MSNIVNISKKYLPQDEQRAIEYLYDYFNNFDITLKVSNNSYDVQLTKNEYSYCEDISKGLEFLGISEQGIDTYCNVKNNSALCLSENWLVYAYAKIMEKKNYNIKKMTIIHVDDHTDLMKPFIYWDNGKYYNMINNQRICFNNSSSLKQAIMSGAITIGSMLTAIVYSQEQTEIFHLKQNAETKSNAFYKTTVFDSVLMDNAQRISIDFSNQNINYNNYTLTSNWEYIIQNIKINIPCILHIDMDYFNNRYNASTSWKENANRHDPNFIEQKKSMDTLICAVERILKKVDINCVLIGISPSFYPVEYWNAGLKYLIEGLDKLGLNTLELLERNSK